VLTDVGVTLGHTSSALIDLGGGLGLDLDGVYSLNPDAAPELLSNIVDDLASLTPASAYDNSEGTTRCAGSRSASR
jgi:hypothetical protein